MKEQKYNMPLIWLIALFCTVSLTVFAGPRSEFTKTINREFTTTKDGKVDLSNKYGKVKIETWDENRVKIDITIVVNADNQSTADEGFDRISVNFMNTVGMVKAETVLAENKNSNSWWNPVSWNSRGNSCDDFRINYVVYMPKTNDLILSNKYGDSHLNSLSGRLKANIKYGDLNVQEISNKVNLTLAYGEADFEQAEDIDADVSYGDLNIENAHDINLEIKYSEVEIDKASMLTIRTRYDDFKLGEIKEIRMNAAYSDGRIKSVDILEIEADYTDVKIDYLSKSVLADLDYSDIRFEKVSRYFSSIEVDGDYSDFLFAPEMNTGFSFDFKGNYTDFRMEPNANYTQKQKESSRKTYKGQVGSGGGVVKARMSYGDFVVR